MNEAFIPTLSPLFAAATRDATDMFLRKLFAEGLRTVKDGNIWFIYANESTFTLGAEKSRVRTLPY